MNLYLGDLGVVSALGAGKQDTLKALLAGSHAGMLDTGPLLTGRRSLQGVVGVPLEAIADGLGEFDCRNNRLLATAARQIDDAIADAAESYGRDRIAVVIGTSTSGVASREEAHDGIVRDDTSVGYSYRQQEIGTSAVFLARHLRLQGPRYTISTACSSSAKAVAAAARLIRAGRCDAAVVGGSDSLCRLTLNGFDSLESLSPGPCNPFSRNRSGINIGEAASVFLLTSRKSDIALLGSGESSDAYNMAAPEPQGRGAEAAMRGALGSAGIDAADVDYINLHGTATPKNDEMEAAAVNRVFGPDVQCSSTKSQTGHALGAAGALELGLAWLLLSEMNFGRSLPRHLWDGERDEGLADLNLTGAGARWKRGIVLSNTFGFGGSNASVLLGRRH